MKEIPHGPPTIQCAHNIHNVHSFIHFLFICVSCLRGPLYCMLYTCREKGREKTMSHTRSPLCNAYHNTLFFLFFSFCSLNFDQNMKMEMCNKRRQWTFYDTVLSSPHKNTQAMVNISKQATAPHHIRRIP